MLHSKELRRKVDELLTRRDILCESADKLVSKRKKYESRHSAAIKAREILFHVAQDTQKSIEQNIGRIVSLALNAIFDEPYDFKIEFVKRRNKMECDLFLESNGEKMIPSDSVGGGVLDVISFSLRLAFVMLSQSRRILILDEPMKNLSRNYQPKAAEMIKMLSEKLGIQVIMTTHIPEFISSADKLFELK